MNRTASFEWRKFIIIILYGESLDSEPIFWIGNNGYHPVTCSQSFNVSTRISALPRPWLCSKPFCRSHSITTRDLSDTSRTAYFNVWLNSGVQLLVTTRVLRFSSNRSLSRRYIFTYVSVITRSRIIRILFRIFRHFYFER